MKILFLLSLNLSKQGPSVHVLSSLIAHLADIGHQVHIVQQCFDDNAPFLPDALCNNDAITCEGIHVPMLEKSNFIRRYIVQKRYAMAAGRRIKAHCDADIIYVHSCNTLSIFAWFAKWYAKKASLVVNVQDIFPENAAMVDMIKRTGLLYRIMA